MAIGTAVKVSQPTKVAVKSSSPVAVKSRDGGSKMKVPRAGVARYVVPTSNPVVDHNPESSVRTGGGTPPVPRTPETAARTPPTPNPPPPTKPTTKYGHAETAEPTSYT